MGMAGVAVDSVEDMKVGIYNIHSTMYIRMVVYTNMCAKNKLYASETDTTLFFGCKQSLEISTV